MMDEDDTPAPKPETCYPPARMVALTGLPDPEAIADPERLERLAYAIRHKLSHLAPNSPLRVQVACLDYMNLVDWCLENPQRFDESAR